MVYYNMKNKTKAQIEREEFKTFRRGLRAMGHVRHDYINTTRLPVR